MLTRFGLRLPVKHLIKLSPKSLARSGAGKLESLGHRAAASPHHSGTDHIQTVHSDTHTHLPCDNDTVRWMKPKETLLRREHGR